jgi:hypothetical protein
MEHKHHVTMGTREIWGKQHPFGISADDRRHHCYVLGKTGTGKTTLLRNLILQDIDAGCGVGVIDPHGDLAADLLDFIPRNRIEDVTYFDPGDPEYSPAFNVFDTERDHHLVASGVVAAMKAIWRDSWGPRLEYILYAAVAALLECDNVSLMGVSRMLSDTKYRVWVVKQVKDPMVRSFWVNEFESYDRRFMHEVIAPIQNKVGQILMSPKLRNVLGQVSSKIDARFMMDKAGEKQRDRARKGTRILGFPHPASVYPPPPRLRQHSDFDAMERVTETEAKFGGDFGSKTDRSRQNREFFDFPLHQKLSFSLSPVSPSGWFELNVKRRSFGYLPVVSRTNPNRPERVFHHLGECRETDLGEDRRVAAEQALCRVVPALGSFEHHEHAKWIFLEFSGRGSVAAGETAGFVVLEVATGAGDECFLRLA